VLTCGSFFSGTGLLDFGLTLAGLEHVWLCESKPERRDVLARRWPNAHIFEDVRAVDATAPGVRVAVGGFPCKGASSAGLRNGFDHPETALWAPMAEAIGHLRPDYVLVENVANILSLRKGAVWGRVLGDLAALGYDVEWDCLPAAAVGAPHRRDRVFAVAAHSDLGAVGPGRLWRGEREADQEAPADAGRMGWGAWRGLRQSVTPGRWWRRPADGDREAPADAERVGRHEARPEVREGRSEAERRGLEAVADAHGGRLEEQQERDRERWLREYGPQRDDAQRRGVRVEWGIYEAAIRRWEAVHGPAPEPLVRRVDDRGAARVERSRLSALGDGVQVHVGLLAGAYIVGLEQQRRELADAA
jgi:DNA (cytosine-5)-methyltransferase 1